MCGICGFITDNNVTEEQLTAMNNTMVHRGPDDSGTIILPYKNNKRIGLAHRRLSILDLSKNGHQPFFSQNKDIIVVFNGEIYNFLELRKKLNHYSFRTNCDTEVIIAAYETWGKDFVSYLNGMFAFALYDKNNESLMMVRDRLGKKPLYYYYDEHNLVFGSTLQSLMAYPFVDYTIDKRVIPRYLMNSYIGGDECILSNVHKVRHGEIVYFNGKGITKTRYWDLIDIYKTESVQQYKTYAEAKSAIKNELINSVKQRLIADVPVGAFLSGGYDSALVTAVAQSLVDKPIKTFSIGFEEKEYDEAPYAEAIAEHLGTDHTTHYVTEQEMLDLVKSIPEYYDEPFADSSQIPSMLVAKIAKKDVTVVLTGDGGDELFCGYQMYDKLLAAQKIEPLAIILRPFYNKRLQNKIPFKIKAILSNTDQRYKTQFGREFYEEAISRMIESNIVDQKIDETYIDQNNWVIRRMLLDADTYLTDNNLCKVDRATMRYSLEARNPLLDYHVVKSAFKTPYMYKYYKKDKKHILKDITHDFIPKELMDRPKMGFAVPRDKWMRGVLKEDVIKMTSKKYLESQGIFDPDYTEKFVINYLDKGDSGAFTGHNPSQIVWPLYMFQKWYQRYMEKR